MSGRVVQFERSERVVGFGNREGVAFRGVVERRRVVEIIEPFDVRARSFDNFADTVDAFERGGATFARREFGAFERGAQREGPITLARRGRRLFREGRERREFVVGKFRNAAIQERFSEIERESRRIVGVRAPGRDARAFVRRLGDDGRAGKRVRAGDEREQNRDAENAGETCHGRRTGTESGRTRVSARGIQGTRRT